MKQGITKLEGPIHSRLTRFLLSYRITPHTSTGQSPAEILMGRLRTRLDMIHPDSTSRILQKQQKQIDENKTPRKFKIGDKLFAKDYSSNQANWIPVTVTQITGPVSYKVKNNSGQFLRRHVDQLRSRHIPDNNSNSDVITDFGPTLTRNQPSQNNSTNTNPAGANSSSASTTTSVRRSRIRTPINRYAPLVST